MPLCVRSRPDLHCHRRTSTRDYPRSPPRSPEATRGSRPTPRPTPWPRCSWSGRRTRGRRRARGVGGLALAYSDDGRGRWGAVVAQSREWECTSWLIIRGPKGGVCCAVGPRGELQGVALRSSVSTSRSFAAASTASRGVLGSRVSRRRAERHELYVSGYVSTSGAAARIFYREGAGDPRGRGVRCGERAVLTATQHSVRWRA